MKRKNEEKKEKMQTKKNQKQTKQSEKQPKKHLYFWRKKKSVCMSGRKFCTPFGYEHVN